MSQTDKIHVQARILNQHLPPVELDNASTDELLNFWENSQMISTTIAKHLSSAIEVPANRFEEMIIAELLDRDTRRRESQRRKNCCDFAGEEREVPVYYRVDKTEDAAAPEPETEEENLDSEDSMKMIAAILSHKIHEKLRELVKARKEASDEEE